MESRSEASLPSRCGCVTATACLTLSAVVGALAAACGPMYVRRLTDAQLDAQVIVDSVNAPGYAGFVNATSSGEVSDRYWVFNVTNPEDVLLKGAKVSVEELGPFIYRAEQIRFEASGRQ